jgi:hypothetical protein
MTSSGDLQLNYTSQLISHVRAMLIDAIETAAPEKTTNAIINAVRAEARYLIEIKQFEDAKALEKSKHERTVDYEKALPALTSQYQEKSMAIVKWCEDALKALPSDVTEETVKTISELQASITRLNHARYQWGMAVTEARDGRYGNSTIELSRAHDAVYAVINKHALSIMNPAQVSLLAQQRNPK